MQLYYILRPIADLIHHNQDIAGLLFFTSIALIAYFILNHKLSKQYERKNQKA